MKKTAVYPGTFDPVTLGHIDLIERASKIFDEVIVAIAHSLDKNPLFTVQERKDMLKRATSYLKNVIIDDFDGLVVDYMAKKHSNVVIRGLRMISDFEYEFQMALTNRKLNENIETIFMMPKENYSYISSRLIKEAAALGANLTDLVPDFVEGALKAKLRVLPKIYKKRGRT